jgi:hypothetical protein
LDHLGIGQEYPEPDRRGDEDMAGMLRKVLASGIAAKVIQEAQKPQNQAKIKEFIAKMGDKNKKQGGGRGYGRGPVR